MNGLKVTDIYSTHLPLFSCAIRNTTGPILECGMGDYSTGKIIELTRGTLDRTIFSIEPDSHWFMDMCHQFQASRELRPNWTMIRPDSYLWLMNPIPVLPQFDVVLIDSGPGPERLWLLKWALTVNKSKCIVVHDVEDKRYLVHDELGTCHVIDRRQTPHTAAIMNFPSAQDDSDPPRIRLYNALIDEVNKNV